MRLILLWWRKWSHSKSSIHNEVPSTEYRIFIYYNINLKCVVDLIHILRHCAGWTHMNSMDWACFNTAHCSYSQLNQPHIRFGFFVAKLQELMHLVKCFCNSVWWMNGINRAKWFSMSVYSHVKCIVHLRHRQGNIYVSRVCKCTAPLKLKHF